jgi:GTP-binding protein
MRSRFIISCPAVGDCPELGLPEFAMLGRSNVGKSSLLNALAESKIARTSRTPGRTQLINLFELATPQATFALADLPGFGYARAPKAIARAFAPLIDAYLGEREALMAVLLLVDVRRGAEEEERALVERIKQRTDVVPLIVGTKLDKLPKAQQKPALHRIAKTLDVPKEGCFGTSASRREGIAALRDTLETLSRHPTDDRPY